jgi:hypothetical protein
MNDQELRAKSMEIAVLIKGGTKILVTPQNISYVIREYEPLANAIKQYISTGVIPLSV